MGLMLAYAFRTFVPAVVVTTRYLVGLALASVGVLDFHVLVLAKRKGAEAPSKVCG